MRVTPGSFSCSGCCRAALSVTPLTTLRRHWGQYFWCGRQSLWFSFLRRGTSGCVPTTGGSHSLVSLLRSTPEALCSRLWSSGDKNHYLLIWGHGSQAEEGRLHTPSQGRFAFPCGKVQVSQGFSWVKEKSRGRWRDLDHVDSDVDAKVVGWGEERAQSEGEALNLPVPTLPYSHELWLVTKRMRLWMQAAEMSFLRRVAGLRDGGGRLTSGRSSK